jgi:hypothetical protein
MVNNVIGVVNYAIAVPPSLLNFMIADTQVAFIRGACTAVRRIVAPAAWKTASKDPVKVDPRSC